MEATKAKVEITPERIMQVGTGFWGSKVLLAAVNFGLFTKLAASGALSAIQIKKDLKWNCTDRHAYDFLDTLTGMGFLQRNGLLDNAVYSNSPETDFFLDKKKPSYMGGMLEMLNNRLYFFWGDLESGLLTGQPQNEIKNGVDNPFDELYKTPDRLKEFVNAMSGIQIGNFMTLAKKFDFSPYKKLVDAGGSSGILSIIIAKHHPNMHCLTIDLPPVEPIARENIEAHGLTGRVEAGSLDFFSQPLPKADVVVMGNILHDWNEEKKLQLMKNAYDALPKGGAFIAIEGVIDNERRQNVFGLLMSLNMLIETGKGFDYTPDDFDKWASQTGFDHTEFMPLAGPFTAAIAYK